MKRTTLFLILLCLASLFANAQWKVTSVASAEPNTKLLQVINTENSTLIYATISKNCTEDHLCTLNRGTYVKANGMKYKVLHSVNLPLGDDAEPRYASMEKGLNEINFVMEFEKFPVETGFDIIESDKDGELSFNFHGVSVSPIKESEVIDTKRFLDSGTPVIVGKYAENGSHYLFAIRDGVCVTCRGVIRSGEGFSDDEIFYVDIVNDSDHGIMFDFNKVNVCGVKKKSNGEEERKAWVKYTPESYDQYLERLDYQEARSRTSGALDIIGSQINREKTLTEYGSWERVGLEALSALNEQAINNRVNQYLENNPSERPAGLRSNSIKAGEAIHGYIASKKKKADEVVLTIPMDSYNFKFTFTLK